MKKGIVIGLIVSAVFCFILAVAVSVIGTQLDEAKIQREDLKVELARTKDQADSLRYERDSLKTSQEFTQVERESLEKKVGDQLKAIEQLKAELDRVRNSHSSSNAAASSINSNLVQERQD